MESFYENALEYLNLNRSIIPLRPGKKTPYSGLLPRGSDKRRTWRPYSERLATVEEVKNWVQKCGDNANIGQVMGRVSGVFALDVDFRKEGESTWISLSQGIDIPTEKVQTGDGFHILFQHPGYNFRLKVPLPGIDLRSDGSYLVAPPSIHPNGKIYRFERRGNVLLPPRFVEELVEPVADTTVLQTSRKEAKGGVNLQEALRVFERCEARRHRYDSRSEFDFAVMVSLANRGCDLNVVRAAFEASRSSHDTHYRKVFEKHGTNRARDYLARHYAEALQQPDREKYQIFYNYAVRMRALVESQSWTGISGRTDRAVLLAHIEKMEMAKVLDPSGLPVWNASVRELAELARCGFKTAWQSTLRLQDGEWVTRICECSHTHLQSASFSPGQALMPALNEWTCSPVHISPEIAGVMHPVFESGCGLGKAAARIWTALQEGRRSVREIAERAQVHRTTVERCLRTFEQFSMAQRVGGLITPSLSCDLDAIARDLGATLKAQIRIASHQNDRDSYRWFQEQAMARRNAPD